MSNLLARFFKFLLPILRLSAIQAALDVLNNLAYPSRRRSPTSSRPFAYDSNPYNRSRGYISPVETANRRREMTNPFMPGTANYMRHQHGLPPIESSRRDEFHDVLLVAFDVAGPNAIIVHEWLQNQLPNPVTADFNGAVTLDSWWVANDERFDRSDCDSAVFVPMGSQVLARQVLKENGIIT